MRINLLLLSISAFIIDASIVLTLSLLLNYFLIQFLYVEILKVFLGISFIYMTIAYAWKGQTPAKYLLGLSLKTKEGNNPSLVQILKREFGIKYLLGIIIPFAILVVLGYDDFYLNTGFILACLIVFTILFWLITKKTWWDMLAGTRVERKHLPTKHRVFAYFLLLIFLSSSFFLIRFANNQKQNAEPSFLGFNNPVNYDYPRNDKVNSYFNFLSKPHLSPKDYIFELFKTHDIVILCERWHPETTQSDFIYDVISDKRFADSVGNVITELGNIDKQTMVDTFLTTKFPNDTLLEKSVANLMHYLVTVHENWNPTNFFYFLKRLNLLNNTLPDTLKIREYFTNLASWDLVHNKKQYDSINKYNYDSLMANNVIHRYRQIKDHERRKKCLVITNWRHAFIRNIPKPSRDEATYIYNAFPQTTANVLINTVAMKYTLSLLWIPIQMGAWDKAFSLNENKPMGFDFKGNPFGEAEFELLQRFPLGRNVKYRYQDVFTGFVFVNPIKEFREQDAYPYMWDGFEKEYVRRSLIKNSDTAYLSSMIEDDKFSAKHPVKGKPTSLGFMNCIELVIFLLSLLLAFFISTYHILISGIRKKEQLPLVP